MSTDPNKKLEKKRRIIESAYQLFKSKNIYNTAVDDIVKAAGIARGTFYLYFRDKSDLIDQLVFYKSGESMKEILSKAAEIAGQSQTLSDYARVMVGSLIDSLLEHKEVLAVVNKNLSSCMRNFPSFYDPEAQALYDGVARRAEAFGLSRAEFERAAYLIFEMVIAASCDAIIFGQPYTIENLREPLIASSLAILTSFTCSKGGESHEEIA